MSNYLKSEGYRLLRRKGLYVTGFVSLGLVLAAAAVLAYSQQVLPNFPYGTSRFLYANVFGMDILILLVGSIISCMLTRVDSAVLKQSISFGISRRRIFLTKLVLTLAFFMVLCTAGVLLITGLGETLLIHDPAVLKNFVIGVINMIPLVLSGFVLSYVIGLLGFGDFVNVIALMAVYGVSGRSTHAVIAMFSSNDPISRFLPSDLLSKVTADYMRGNITFQGVNWLIGALIAVVSVLIGLRLFERKSIQ